ncbi:Pkinase-domain-containing protein [Durotheca rogersii]|uniref:Pkinase-domain-containing protein n=1 Tax=Durotheca rogersii TaxID=419775 RepID=UPI00221EE883|nr:Pkinase-domain-containing protein [Durotheca rogersii]KAI5868412.1 Pkinase-domain-containing protein [Durotheca rogersii]
MAGSRGQATAEVGRWEGGSWEQHQELPTLDCPTVGRKSLAGFDETEADGRDTTHTHSLTHSQRSLARPPCAHAELPRERRRRRGRGRGERQSRTILTYYLPRPRTRTLPSRAHHVVIVYFLFLLPSLSLSFISFNFSPPSLPLPSSLFTRRRPTLWGPFLGPELASIRLSLPSLLLAPLDCLANLPPSSASLVAMPNSIDADKRRSLEPLQGCSVAVPEPTDGPAELAERAPAVRFASTIDEIDPPSASLALPETRQEALPATPDLIRALSRSLHGTVLQEERLKNYSFAPVSLPPSRVVSNETTPSATPQHSHSPMGHPSPRLSPKAPELASPPLTPAGTSAAADYRNAKPGPGPGPDRGFDSRAITPQASGQDSRPDSPRIGLTHRPASSDNISQRSTAVDENDGGSRSTHRRGMFSIGPGDGSSVPVSRETSPARYTASHFYSRPFTPHGDANDPYAASRRPPQKLSGSIDQRFVFAKKKKRGSPSASSTNLSKIDKQEKRHSTFFTNRNKSGDLHPARSNSTAPSTHGSMSDLKRFFKVGVNHKPKKSTSPSPLGSRATPRVPFADDHGLSAKYGKLGRVLGAGAGGSVKLMRRTDDNTVFAVKEFRPRHSYETEKEYVKKLTAEFCIGSALHHGNIIETLDIVQEKGKWYEVMEYAPFDLFAIVMTGRMSKPEIFCCFLQILSGVTYLHSSGLAHRDLKLDNVVVSQHGIMKIIDFGSAHVFRYPFESEIVLAAGVVGSDPYLAPEVYDERKYDPQAVDIWSLAIIFCCMILRRFPWKVPRMTDNSYKFFAAEPSPGHDPKKLIIPSRSTNDLSTIPQRDIFSEEEMEKQKPRIVEPSTPKPAAASGQENKEAKELIRGPWRLLRLLPRESRHIIGRMLTIDPKQRAQMSEILEEPWVSDTVVCRQVEHGKVIHAQDHVHVLEPPAPPSK